MGYIEDTEFATRSLIDLITKDEKNLKEKINTLKSHEQKLKVTQWDYETSEWHDDFSEAYVRAAFHRMAESHKEKTEIAKEIDELQATVGTIQVSLQALCGALLQIAKQGISLFHQRLNNAPQGRMIGTASLAEIIWQARNQSLHYEEGNYHQPVWDLFAKLEASHGVRFSLSTNANQNRAKHIVEILEWHKYDNYQKDMKLLGI